MRIHRDVYVAVFSTSGVVRRAPAPRCTLPVASINGACKIGHIESFPIRSPPRSVRALAGHFN